MEDISKFESIEVTYDKYGRMNYNPEFHKNMGKSWTYDDVKYLIDWYEVIGLEEMSFALERTVKSIQGKVQQLRNEGIMKRGSKRTKHIRMHKGGEVNA